MTVKELIEQLGKLPQDKQVILQHTDHKDWTYTTGLSSDSIYEDKWYDEESDSEGKLYEDCLEDVVIIDCIFW